METEADKRSFAERNGKTIRFFALLSEEVLPSMSVTDQGDTARGLALTTIDTGMVFVDNLLTVKEWGRYQFDMQSIIEEISIITEHELAHLCGVTGFGFDMVEAECLAAKLHPTFFEKMPPIRIAVECGQCGGYMQVDYPGGQMYCPTCSGREEAKEE